MRLSPKLISIALFALAIILFTLLFTRETKVVSQPAAPEPADHVVDKYIEKVQLQSELERDEQQAAYMHEKMAKAKKESVECKFWQQQLAAKDTPKNKDKVTQFCELATEDGGASSSTESLSAQKSQ